MEKKTKVSLPKKDAGRKLAARLKDLGKQQPPKDIVNKINGGDVEEKKIAAARSRPQRDLDL
jgi:hypothetical protein